MQLTRDLPPSEEHPKIASYKQSEQAVRSQESRAVGWLSFISSEATSQFKTYLLPNRACLAVHKFTFWIHFLPLILQGEAFTVISMQPVVVY